MSLILDALDRARQDTGKTPDLDTRHYDDSPEDDWNPYQLLLVSALLVALIVIGWLLWDREPESEPIMPGTVGTNQASVAAAPELPPLSPPAAGRTVPPRSAAELTDVSTATRRAQPQQAPAAVRPAPSGGVASQRGSSLEPTTADPGVAALYREHTPSRPVVTRPEAEPASVQSAPAKVEKVAAAPKEAKPEVSVEAKNTVEEQPIDIEAMVLQARQELANARLSEHDAPFIAELSQQTKNTIPTILYQSHDYSSAAGKSSVMLNGKTLKVRGAASSGLKVDEILPGSVILSYRGTQFRLRALNSWVNL